MAKEDFARRVWHMAKVDEIDRFRTLNNSTKWVWFETVMNLDLSARLGNQPGGIPDLSLPDLAIDLNIQEVELQRQIDILLSRGLLRRSTVGDISLPHELKISAAHGAAKIVALRSPPTLVAVGTSG